MREILALDAVILPLARGVPGRMIQDRDPPFRASPDAGPESVLKLLSPTTVESYEPAHTVQEESAVHPAARAGPTLTPSGHGIMKKLPRRGS
jgi:hypothetical protein